MFSDKEEIKADDQSPHSGNPKFEDLKTIDCWHTSTQSQESICQKVIFINVREIRKMVNGHKA